MFSRLKDKLKSIGMVKVVGALVAIPLGASSLTFVANVLLALQDGVISDQEFHSLVQKASLTDMLFLCIVLVALKYFRRS